MKKIFFLLLIVSFSGIAQSVNDYKYVIIPTRYDFQNQENQFKLNTLTKANLTKLGYTAFYETTIPAELAGDKCDKLFIDVIKVSSTFKVKLKIVFKDCWNKVIYTSEIGKGQDKEYATGYPQALEDAFKSVATLNYAYNGNTKFGSPSQSTVKPATITEVSQPIAVSTTVNPNQLFAQPIANGFQLVDNTPKIVLKLTRTSQADYFMATSDNKQGVVYLKNNEWLFDYYKDDQLISEKLSIKF
ncbi:MAG: hypothetical protein PSV16_14495 [Flavobacterium sp.]|nr:hypothetical protein [Flavobacterium sp.]